MLYAVLCESVDIAKGVPLSTILFLSSIFALNDNGTLTMYRSDTVSSFAATHLHIYRVGFCCILYEFSKEVPSTKAKELCIQCRESPTITNLCTIIRRTREMTNKKGPSVMKTITPDHTINIGTFSITKSVWSTLIPRTQARVMSTLDDIFETKDWKKIMDPSFPINVCSDTVTITNENVNLQQLVHQDSMPLDSLHGSIEHILFCFGGGAVRHTELLDMTIHKLKWHNNHLYYFPFSTKTGSLVSSKIETRKSYEHKLPGVLSRVVLLYNTIIPLETENSLLLRPYYTKRNVSSLNYTFQEITGITEKPSVLHIRSFITSIQNIIFPETSTDSPYISCEPFVAEMSGHTAETHTKQYSSYDPSKKEKVYKKMHECMGELVHNHNTVIGLTNQSRLSDEFLNETLKLLYGPGATYQSSLQKKMVLCSANEYQKHAFIGIPCGGGKSLSWILPTLTRFHHDLPCATTIVIVPYKFLCQHHYTSFIKYCSANKKFSKVRSCFLCKSDFVDNTILPTCLSNEILLPNILFITVDGFESMFIRHKASMERWIQNNLLVKIYIDEIHLLYGETYRKCHDIYPRLSELKCPIMTLSGTLPNLLIYPMLEYLNQTTETTEGVTIETSQFNIPTDIIFKIHKKCINEHQMVEKAGQRCMDFLCKHGDSSTHIIVSDKKILLLLAKYFELHNEKFRFSVVSSETLPDVQCRIAELWNCGKTKILVSTTIGLVGTESPYCQQVIIVGYLYSLINVIQAFGRIRPHNKTQHSTVEMILPSKMSSNSLSYFTKKDNANRVILKTKGLLKDETSLSYNNLFTFQSLYKWVNEESKCCFWSLATRVGASHPISCNTCYRCTSSNFSKHQTFMQEKMNTCLPTKNKGIALYRQMKVRCINCSSEKCNGLPCLNKRLKGRFCFKCGNPNHGSSQCSFTPATVLYNKACYSCYIPYCIGIQHKIPACPTQERMKPVLFLSYRAYKKKDNSLTFEDYLSKVYTNELEFCKLLVNFRERTKNKI